MFWVTGNESPGLEIISIHGIEYYNVFFVESLSTIKVRMLKKNRAKNIEFCSSKKFQGNFKGISRKFQGCLKRLKEVSSSFKEVSRVLERSLKGVSGNFQGCFKGVSRKFQKASGKF